MRWVPLRIGVMGAGYAAEHLHWPAFRRVPDIQVVSVYDVDRRRAELLASRLPGATAMSGAEDVIADRSLEAVAILTPPATHGAVLADALKEKKHVFVEKPLTSVPDEVDGMVEATRASGCVVAVGHNLRCHRLVRRARELVQSGALGDLLAIRMVWTSPVRPRPSWMQAPGLAGSVLLEIAVHHVDLFHYLTGHAVRTVH
ncbi:MAG: Gfo/Idh/MocA family protein, partial [Bryobacteraceae bacterium]